MAAKKTREFVAFFKPDAVTKGAVRYIECTATGKDKEKNSGLVRMLYIRHDMPGGVGLSDEDDDGNQYLDANFVKATIELTE